MSIKYLTTANISSNAFVRSIKRLTSYGIPVAPGAAVTAYYVGVGGGGAGGDYFGGGGGGGGVEIGSVPLMQGTPYTVFVGAGASGGTSPAASRQGASGGNTYVVNNTTSANVVVAAGGGGGGGWAPGPVIPQTIGRVGGAGGGGGAGGTAPYRHLGGLAYGSPDLTVVGLEGWPGGTTISPVPGAQGSGGGGGGATGGNAAVTVSGGIGANTSITGTLLTLAGGGSGNWDTYPAPTGNVRALGGGGFGAGNPAVIGSAGALGSGGGGGGANGRAVPTSSGYAGGTGTFIFAIPTPVYSGTYSPAPAVTVTTFGGNTILRSNSSFTYTA